MKDTLPIATIDLKDLNKVFSDFRDAYEGTYKRYARRQQHDDMTFAGIDFKELVKMDARGEDHYVYPAFMREFLGFGIVPSFNTIPDLQARKIVQDGAPIGGDTPKSSSPSKVGLALSTFHTVIRNAGKEWGLYFDKSVLDDEFEGILDWMEKPEKYPLPVVYEGKSNQEIRDDVMKRFAALESVPLKVKGVRSNIPNTPIHVKRVVDYGEADTIYEEYDVPAAAAAWGIRHAGMSVLGRPSDSPMRLFLERAIGVANEAGRKVVALNNIAPDVFSDYDRDAIRKTLQDQKYWIKTAAAVERILGKDDKGYAGALALIGEDSKQIDFYSANKTGVLLYTLAEKFERIKVDMLPRSEDRYNRFTDTVESDAQAKEAIRRINTMQNGMAFDDVMVTLKELAGKLADAGIETEKALDVAKRDDFSQPDPATFYAEEKHRIFEQQRTRVADIFQGNPKYEKTVEALRGYAQALRQPASITEDVMHCIEVASGFCMQHVSTTQKAASAAEQFVNR